MIDDTIKPADTAKASKPAPTRRTRSTGKAAPARKRPATPSTMVAPGRNVKRATAAAKPTAAKPPAQAPKPAAGKKVDQPVKAKKVKLVRDSFTMPETEYAQIAQLKKRCLNAGVSVKKSEILRAAVAGLAKLGDSSVVTAIRRLEVIKTGRPAKAKDSK